MPPPSPRPDAVDEFWHVPHFEKSELRETDRSAGQPPACPSPEGELRPAGLFAATASGLRRC